MRNIKYMKRFHSFLYALVMISAIALFGGVTAVRASTLTAAQIQALTGLLQSFNVDSATIANVQAILENKTAPAQIVSGVGEGGLSGESGQISNANNCLVISNNLHYGSTDKETEGEVSRLQTFLGKNKDIYPENAVTGFFGPATEKAVENWQAAHNVVSSGDSTTTGYGSVGPKTRGEIDKEMETECERGDSVGGDNGDKTASSTGSTNGSESKDN